MTKVDRDASAQELMRCRDQRADEWADIIDMLTMHLDARRMVARMLAEIDAASD